MNESTITFTATFQKKDLNGDSRFYISKKEDIKSFQVVRAEADKIDMMGDEMKSPFRFETYDDDQYAFVTLSRFSNIDLPYEAGKFDIEGKCIRSRSIWTRLLVSKCVARTS